LLRSRDIILLVVTGSVLVTCNSCNNYSISEKQAESFLKYFPISINDNQGYDVIQTINGGYVIMANFSNPSITGSDQDIPIIVCDEFGRQESISPILVGTSGSDWGYNMTNVDDGYLIAGSSSLSGSSEGLLIKLGISGQLLWQKNYNYFEDMEFRHATHSLEDGSYIVTGSMRDTNSIDNDEVILFKVTPNGDSTWFRRLTYYGDYDDQGESVVEYLGRILIICTSSPNNLASIDHNIIRVLNTDPLGRPSYELPIHSDQDLSGLKILRNPSGKLYILGNEYNAFNKSSRIYLAHIELSGGGNEIVTIAKSTYLDDGGSAEAFDLIPYGITALAFCGTKFAQNDYNIFFGMVNDNLELTLSKSFGSKGYQSANGLSVTGDEGFALTGTVDLGGGRTSMLLKLDSDGELR